MTITCKYSCFACGVHRALVPVKAREDEDVKVWLDRTALYIRDYHQRLHPHCTNTQLDELMIPMDGRDRIGGPPIQ